MANRIWLIAMGWMLWGMVPVHAQDNFYLQLLKEGKQRLVAQDYEGAEQFLEIAAFGLLDFPDPLFEAYVCQVVAFADQNHQEKLDRIVIKIRTLYPDRNEKPEKISDEVWARYQAIMNPETAVNVARSKDDIAALRAHVAKHPKDVTGWIALIEVSMPSEPWKKLRKTIDQSLKANPDDPDLLRAAVVAAHEHGESKQGRQFALRLLDQETQDSLAREFLGNLAVKKGRWEEAAAHFAFVKTARFSETEGNRAAVMQHSETNSEEPENSDEQEAEPAASAPPPAEQSRSSAAPERQPAATPRQLEAMVKKNPADLDSRWRLVAHYLDAGQMKKAKRHLREIGTAAPGDPRYLEFFCQYCYQAGQHQTNADLRDTRTDRSDKADLYVGLSLLELGRFDEARAVLQPLDRSAFPQLTRADERIAAAAKQPKLDSASDGKPSWAELARLVGSGAASFAQKAHYVEHLIDQNEWSEAGPLIKSMNKSNPKEPLSQYFLARQLLNEQDFQQAAQVFSNLTNAGYHDKETFYYGGLAYYQCGKKEFANYLFSRALRSGSQFKDQIIAIQNRLHAEKEAQKQQNTLRVQLDRKIAEFEAERKKTDRPDCRIALLRLYHETGQQDAFESLYKQMRDEPLDREQGDLVLAWRMLSREEHGKALRLIEAYDCPEAVYIKGYLHFLMDEPREGNHVLADLKNHADRFPELDFLLRTGHL